MNSFASNTRLSLSFLALVFLSLAFFSTACGDEEEVVACKVAVINQGEAPLVQLCLGDEDNDCGEFTPIPTTPEGGAAVVVENIGIYADALPLRLIAIDSNGDRHATMLNSCGEMEREHIGIQEVVFTSEVYNP